MWHVLGHLRFGVRIPKNPEGLLREHTCGRAQLGTSRRTSRALGARFGLDVSVVLVPLLFT